jgi:hypothetical protein
MTNCEIHVFKFDFKEKDFYYSVYSAENSIIEMDDLSTSSIKLKPTTIVTLESLANEIYLSGSKGE